MWRPPQSHHIADGNNGIGGGVLLNKGHLPRHDLARHAGDVLSKDFDAPGLRGLQPGQQPEQRGLARSVGADQAKGLAFGNVE